MRERELDQGLRWEPCGVPRPARISSVEWPLIIHSRLRTRMPLREE